MQIKALHQYDCLRANKATSAWGLEARVPFLDKQFINTAMSIDPQNKMVRILMEFSLKIAWFLTFNVNKLDRKFNHVGLCFTPFQINKDVGRIEKWALRRAFDDEEHPYLPKVHNFPLKCIDA